MRLIVDSTILFAALIKESTARWFLFHLDIELITISFSYQEVEKYKEYILKKSNLSEEQFNLLLNKIKEKLIELSDETVEKKFDEAYQLMRDIDLKDAPFLAAALATNAHIWSDDPQFQLQKKIKVWKTKDLMTLL